MSKFKKKTETSQDIPTAALPDIIFMLLFFFMVTTVLRTDELLVETEVPQATQLRKIARKSLVSTVYIGPPKDTSKFGANARVQLNNVFIKEMKDVRNFVFTEKEALGEERNLIVMSLKIDQTTKMGIITDVEEEFKEANALKLLYNAKPKN